MFSDRTNWTLTRNRLTDALEEVRSSGVHPLDLTLSNPTRAGLRYDEPRILQSLASPQAMDYDPQPKGLLGARAAVADYYHTAHGIYDFDPEHVILTTSTSEGYSFVFLCRKFTIHFQRKGIFDDNSGWNAWDGWHRACG